MLTTLELCPSVCSNGIYFRANMTFLDTGVKTRHCSQHLAPPLHALTYRLYGKRRRHKQVRSCCPTSSDLQAFCSGSHIAIRRAKAADARTIAQICSKVVDVGIGMYINPAAPQRYNPAKDDNDSLLVCFDIT